MFKNCLLIKCITFEKYALSVTFEKYALSVRVRRRFLIYQECPQLAVARADAGVSNPRDLWDAPAVALRFAGSLGSSLNSIRESQGKPTPRCKGVSLRVDALAASALQEGAGGAKQQQQHTDLTSSFAFGVH